MNSNWHELTAVGELPEIVLKSAERPQVLFKHSTRCSISTMALNRLMKLDDAFYSQADFYYLDLIAHRDVSAAIADTFDVHHESPQVVVVVNGEATYDASHMEITVSDLMSEVVGNS
ncbi:MAG: bacillithiol system redox-active protein YtxJ [Bacteroidetes bacterium]|jgi:bacillithiol system protein YtxJ|nr:bacillithiol system redox-active protein YtxJ [Bacteroidota bacterium]